MFLQLHLCHFQFHHQCHLQLQFQRHLLPLARLQRHVQLHLQRRIQRQCHDYDDLQHLCTAGKRRSNDTLRWFSYFLFLQFHYFLLTYSLNFWSFITFSSCLIPLCSSSKIQSFSPSTVSLIWSLFLPTIIFPFLRRSLQQKDTKLNSHGTE